MAPTHTSMDTAAYPPSPTTFQDTKTDSLLFIWLSRPRLMLRPKFRLQGAAWVGGCVSGRRGKHQTCLAPQKLPVQAAPCLPKHTARTLQGMQAPPNIPLTRSASPPEQAARQRGWGAALQRPAARRHRPCQRQDVVIGEGRPQRRQAVVPRIIC